MKAFYVVLFLNSTKTSFPFMTRSNYTLDGLRDLVGTSNFIGINGAIPNSKGFYPKKTLVSFQCYEENCDETVTKSIYSLETTKNNVCRKHLKTKNDIKQIVEDIINVVEERDPGIFSYEFERNQITDIIQKGWTELSLTEFFKLTDFDSKHFFDSEFWFTLNSLEKDVWFRVPDYVIKAIGYRDCGNKSNHRTSLFTLLKRGFVENRDFKLSLNFERVDGSNYTTNKFELEMKRDSFKKLLLKVNTQNSEKIYDYLIAFESHVLRYIQYQKECALFKLSEQQNKKRKIDQAIESSSKIPTVCKNPQGFKVSKGHPALYIIELPRIQKIKFGCTNNLSARLRAHEQDFEEIVLVYALETDNTSQKESLLKMELRARGISTVHEHKGKKYTEIVDSSALDIVKSVMTEVTARRNDAPVIKFSAFQEHEYRMEKEKNRCKEIQLKLKEIELEIELVKLEKERSYN